MAHRMAQRGMGKGRVLRVRRRRLSELGCGSKQVAGCCRTCFGMLMEAGDVVCLAKGNLP